MKDNDNKSNVIEQMVDGIVGSKNGNPSQKEAEMRNRLAGRACEYLMFTDDGEYESTDNSD